MPSMSAHTAGLSGLGIVAGGSLALVVAAAWRKRSARPMTVSARILVALILLNGLATVAGGVENPLPVSCWGPARVMA